MDGFIIALVIVLALAVYFIPTIIAVARGSAYAGVIFALNLFGGWTLIFWIAAFIWSLWPKGHSATSFDVNMRHSGAVDLGFGHQPAYPIPDKHLRLPNPQRSTIDELERLAHLRTIGAISLEEFQAQKIVLLTSQH
ncbi:superinfection immunity protein [Brevundimonas vesicularis]|uniref:Superinfection immunity protein n=1 Tax=Brevundimonas vesicularis TaxID=41276 RepID=A0ABU4KTZ9_BREVE|nr:superinfection immunity protein [Brevundimonas vesicularis]MDX2336508.1 superinfection immunity protein [Brevundimonas vesicularis]